MSGLLRPTHYLCRMKNLFLVCLALFFIVGCKSKKQVTTTIPEETLNQYLEQIQVSPEKKPIYHPSEKKLWQLEHMNLEVKFDWKKQYVLGKAQISMHPHFYAQKTLIIDAVGFDVHKVSLRDQNGASLVYNYDSLQLHITLDKTYQKDETLTIYIDYTAKPNELKVGGSDAISEDKGLYFIDPLDEDPEKPSQIWTQGETQASSKWFPTIDAPNQKMTQQISITVEDKYQTLSNGLLIRSSKNTDGTRTDVWKQDLKHVPYLVMIAVGEYYVEKDSWQKKDGSAMLVDYYVEPAYKDDAMAIFGNTPEMLTFYSDLLGLEYPWQKYSQIFVRDFVSGAMENTTAVIHGDFIQQTKREMIDRNYEFIVAHELFHHWFGDYVTCESWANLPLNESFATYGEYLWEQYKYGQDAADYKFDSDLRDYFEESQTKQEPLIRYYYGDKEDMFDNHSYEKGGCILHMLRGYIGDKAFFTALNLYLKNKAYNTAEVHDLRMAFEEVSGEDLNWFFDQWFLKAGHPMVGVEYQYDSTKQTYTIFTEQRYSLAESQGEFLYRIPVKLNIHTKAGIQNQDITLTQGLDTFSFAMSEPPIFTDFDTEKSLVGVVQENKSLEAWIENYKHSKTFLPKQHSIIGAYRAKNEDSLAFVGLIPNILKEDFWALRLLGMDLVSTLDSSSQVSFTSQIKTLLSDPNSKVRAKAIRWMGSNQSFTGADLSFFEPLTSDSSYLVMATALGQIHKLDESKSTDFANQMQGEDNPNVRYQVARVFADNAPEGKLEYFKNYISSASKYEKTTAVILTEDYLKKPALISQVGSAVKLDFLADLVTNTSTSESVRMQALDAILGIEKKAEQNQEELESTNSYVKQLITQIKSSLSQDDVQLMFSNEE